MLAEKCWDGDPTARPHIGDILSFFEAASCCWVPSTPEAIANLGLDRSITTQKPPTIELTVTASGVVHEATGQEAESGALSQAPIKPSNHCQCPKQNTGFSQSRINGTVPFDPHVHASRSVLALLFYVVAFFLTAILVRALVHVYSFRS